MKQGAKIAGLKPGVDPDKAATAERIATAFKRFNAERPRGSELSQEELGREVANRVGLTEPFTQPAVSRWMNPARPSEPDNRVLAAIADVLKVDRSWLAFGAEED